MARNERFFIKFHALTGKRRFAVFPFGLGKNFLGRLRAEGDALSFHANREKALRCFPSGRLPGGRF